MRTYDRELQSYVEHEHEEYLVFSDISDLATKEELKKVENSISIKHEEISKKVESMPNIESIKETFKKSMDFSKSGLEELANQIAQLMNDFENKEVSVTVNTDYDEGTFTKPNKLLIFDEGYF